MKKRISNRTRLLIMSAVANALKFESVMINGVEVHYDAAVDGAEVWVLDENGNPAPSPNFENVEIEGNLFDIIDSALVAKDVEMEDLTPEAIAALQTKLQELETRLAALEAKLDAPAVTPPKEGQFSKRNAIVF